jgi:internalin A
VLQAQGRDPRGLLREIRKAILAQQIGEKPEESLTPAAFAATFLEDREPHPIEASPTGEPPKLDIQPQRLGPGEKPPEVFISYAWGDDTPAGKIREKTVQELYRALAEDGFLPIRDRDRIRPGERISPFMRQLTRADLVVTVISEKYLRSPYCMFEMYRLWERCQEDPDELAQCVVPIVLEEVKIGDLEERAPYVRHWSARRAKLEALRIELGSDLGPESTEEIRLAHRFARDVDPILCFLEGVLMPRKLQTHLDDGFLAVRDALRRRLQERCLA